MKKILLSIFVIASFALSAKNYKAGEIYSNESYLYGRFEMRMKAAPGSGQLSTFFLYRNNSEQSSTLWQEIDIEIFGKNTYTFQTNVIVERTESSRLQTPIIHTTIPNLSDDFHIYVLEWTPDSINWFFDGELLRTEKVYAQDCNALMSIRFNHWAANLTSWAGTFDKTLLPQYQYVDYFSYSSHTPGAGDNGTDYTLQWRDDFTTFITSRWSKANWTFSENLCDFLPANAYTENDNLVLKIHDVTPLPTSILDVNSLDFSVSPNPFSNNVVITYNEYQLCEVSLIKTNGQILINSLPLNESLQIQINKALANQPKGTYFLIIYKNGILVESKTLIKQ